MELSMNTNYFLKIHETGLNRDYLECAEIAKEAGFNYIDFSGNYYLENDGWREETERIKAGLDKMSIKVNQTHAPYVFENYNDEDYKEYMRRAFEINGIVGSDYIVIHADRYVPGADGYKPEVALNTVYDFYAPYVEYAKKAGFSVAIENLFEPVRNGVRTRYTSEIDEQIAIIEKFNDHSVVACWDFGHGKISNGKDQRDALKRIAPYLKCTHVHDNTAHFESDEHLPVYFGDTNWEQTVDFLREIGYTGKFTYEVGYANLPDKFVREYASLLYRLADHLVNGK